VKLAVVGVAGAAIVVAALGAALVLRITATDSSSAAGRFRGNEAPSGMSMPSFVLRDQNGRTVRADDLRGNVVVLTFLDTKCREACPIIAGEIARAWNLLGPEERAGAVAIAISTNPRDDSRARIRAFLNLHRAQDTIRYLTASVPVMRALWHRFQILSSLESGAASTHSAPVRIYGRDLVWLATQHAGADLTPRNLAHDIRIALGSSSGR